MRYTYKTTGVCSREISFDMENRIISNIQFIGGCPGNLKMIAKILNNWKAEEIVEMCQENLCGMRNTSCADQLAKAIEYALEKEKKYC